MQIMCVGGVCAGQMQEVRDGQDFYQVMRQEGLGAPRLEGDPAGVMMRGQIYKRGQIALGEDKFDILAPTDWDMGDVVATLLQGYGPKIRVMYRARNDIELIMALEEEFKG